MPLSVLSNWMSELERFAPSLRAIRFHGRWVDGLSELWLSCYRYVYLCTPCLLHIHAYTHPVIYLLLYTPFTSYLYIPIIHPYYIHTRYLRTCIQDPKRSVTGSSTKRWRRGSMTCWSPPLRPAGARRVCSVCVIYMCECASVYECVYMCYL